jgi:hypothetical protein
VEAHGESNAEKTTWRAEDTEILRRGLAPPKADDEYRTHLGGTDGRRNVAALEGSDNVADCCHAFAGLKRGYPAEWSSCKKVRCAREANSP